MNGRCKRHALAALVSGPTERGFADEGLRLPDHAVDLAFADALQDATSHPLSPTPAGEEPVRPQEPGRSPFHADQSRVDRFRKQTAAGSGERQEALQGDGYVRYIYPRQRTLCAPACIRLWLDCCTKEAWIRLGNMLGNMRSRPQSRKDNARLRMRSHGRCSFDRFPSRP
jgi:hypothetical protein